jgi:two-component sensor histidine kinase
VVEAAEAEIPSALAIPLGFLINELVTNSAKYARGHISVQFVAISAGTYALSVLDDGPGLPAGFDPAKSKGLGMKIVLALVRQIGGALQISSAHDDRGTRFTVTFSLPQPGAPRRCAAREATRRSRAHIRRG